MNGALLTVVVITALLTFVVMQGGIIFLTAYTLRGFARKGVTLSKRRAIFFSYCFWVFATIVGYVVLVGDMGLFDGFCGILIACLTALASTGLYLWLWQKHERRSDRKPL